MSELNAKPPLAAGASAGQKASGDILRVDSTPNRPSSQSPMLTAALTWLARGVPLVPIQPRSKHLVRGYGPHQRQITTPGECAYWFRVRAVNLGLVCGGRAGLAVLDFDDLGIYRLWRSTVGKLAESYAELTTRGAHIFFYTDSDMPSAKMGTFELKAGGAIIMAAPSVGPTGFVYRPVDPHAAILTVLPNFFLLSEKRQPKDMNDSFSRLQSTLDRSKDIVSRIKAAWPILDTAQSLTKLKTSGGRWYRGLCPFHSESEPSFWVDTERGTFGCFACGARGDVINLFAKLHSLSVKEAIRQMARKLG